MSILITGASSGIGLAIAQYYAKTGKPVIACGRNQEKLDNAFQGQHQVTTLNFDVSQKDQVLACAKQVEQLELLILNAGDCEYFEQVMPFDSDKFERIIQVNLLSMGYCLEAFLDKLLPGGQLVIVSSSAVLVPFPKAQAYGASKAACSYLAKSLSVDLTEQLIDVTLVEPGFVKTPLTDKNTFDMPFLVSVDKATHIITKGIARRKSLIRFPNSLMLLLHTLALLPLSLLAKVLNRK